MDPVEETYCERDSIVQSDTECGSEIIRPLEQEMSTHKQIPSNEFRPIPSRASQQPHSPQGADDLTALGNWCIVTAHRLLVIPSSSRVRWGERHTG
jgi:hypothetical protein